MAGYVEGKNKNQLLKELCGTAQPGSTVHEQQKMGILVRSVEDIEGAFKSLEKSMNNNAKSSNSLARKVFWLNVVLATATVIGTFLAVYQFFIKANV